MKEALERYKRIDYQLPNEILAWKLFGAGFDNLGLPAPEGKGRQPARVPLPMPGADELLVRIDAVGLCFSDVKVIGLGGEHPRIKGRNLQEKPVILGHEVSLTVVRVGENLKKKFKIGQRFIVQADIIYQGKGVAYGYALPGGLTQYGIIGKEILEGDEGCYLIPVKETTGYSEAALTEPWACVEASYLIEHRIGLKKDGLAWFIGNFVAAPFTGAKTKELAGIKPAPTSFSSPFSAPNQLGDLEQLLRKDALPKKIVISNFNKESELAEKVGSLGIEWRIGVAETSQDYEGIFKHETAEKGFDDIIILGTENLKLIEECSKYLAKYGVMNIVSDKPIEEGKKIEIDIGRIHYDGLAFLGSSNGDILVSYQINNRSELKPAGLALFIGAAGPMGQMHIQRAIEIENGPRKIVATDISPERMQVLVRKFAERAKEKGVELVCLTPGEMSTEEFNARIYAETDNRGFDDIVVLAPIPAVIEQAAEFLAENGLMNIFAGVAVGTKAKLDLAGICNKGHRFIGSSGSKISHLVTTLKKTEQGSISPNRSVAAIAGINGVWEGLKAVKEGKFPGKIVIYPQIEDLELTPLVDLKAKLPKVYEKLERGTEWTKEAEEELLKEKLNLPKAHRQDACSTSNTSVQPVSEEREGQLKDYVAIVTGAAQGLGEAISRRLAKEGCYVVLADMQFEKALKVAEELQNAYGRKMLALKVDVTNGPQVREMVEKTVQEFGRIDLLVANAGILKAYDITEFPEEDWRKVIEVNLIGYFLCAKEVAKVMVKQRSGVIIQINSKSGKKGSFRNSAYAASKFGGIGLTQSIALDLAPYGIRVNAICPGNLLDSPLWVDSLYEQYAKRWGITPEEVRRKYESQVPLGRGCTYEDVTNLLVYLASPQASYMTGQAINVTGGEEMR